MGGLLIKIVVLVQNWIILCPPYRKEELTAYVKELTCLAKKPEVLRYL
jgi:hypothetical protein